MTEGEADENAATRPFNEYGRTKLEAEQVFRAWASRGAGRSSPSSGRRWSSGPTTGATCTRCSNRSRAGAPSSSATGATANPWLMSRTSPAAGACPHLRPRRARLQLRRQARSGHERAHRARQGCSRGRPRPDPAVFPMSWVSAPDSLPIWLRGLPGGVSGQRHPSSEIPGQHANRQCPRPRDGVRAPPWSARRLGRHHPARVRIA